MNGADGFLKQVANHVGAQDHVSFVPSSDYGPFSSPSDFHEYCQPDWDVQEEIEQCMLPIIFYLHPFFFSLLRVTSIYLSKSRLGRLSNPGSQHRIPPRHLHAQRLDPPSRFHVPNRRSPYRHCQARQERFLERFYRERRCSVFGRSVEWRPDVFGAISEGSDGEYI